jgi:hypothetical protein
VIRTAARVWQSAGQFSGDGMRKIDAAMIKAMSEDELRSTIAEMIDLLDEGDQDDMFGTEGWRHLLGWDH